MKRKPGESKQHYQDRLFSTRTRNAFNGQRTRAEKYGKECSVTLDEVRMMVGLTFGRLCPYCDEIITRKNFSLDHITSISQGGSFSRDNLQVVCQADNERKGKLSGAEYGHLIVLLRQFSAESRQDVLRRLRMGSRAMWQTFWRGAGKPQGLKTGIETPAIL